MVTESQSQQGDEADPTLATLAVLAKDLENIKESIVSGDVHQGVMAAGLVDVLAERIAALDRLVIRGEASEKEHRQEIRQIEKEHRQEIARMNEKALDAAFVFNEKVTSALNKGLQDVQLGVVSRVSEGTGGRMARQGLFAIAGVVGVIIGALAAVGVFGP